MLNYIFADYKRIMARIPRIILIVIFNAIFVGMILNKWNKAAGNFTSVTFLDSATAFFGFFFMFLVALIDFVQTFTYDFRAKTIQVALGIGVSRLEIVVAKLIQLALVLLTDLLITVMLLFILSGIMGVFMNFQQVSFLLLNGLCSITLVTCSAALLMPLIFRTQSMVLALIGYFLLVPGILSTALDILAQLGPDFLQDLQLHRYMHDSVINLTFTNAIQGAFQLWPVLVSIAWFAVGVYLTWLSFRKMELDF